MAKRTVAPQNWICSVQSVLHGDSLSQVMKGQKGLKLRLSLSSDLMKHFKSLKTIITRSGGIVLNCQGTDADFTISSHDANYFLITRERKIDQSNHETKRETFLIVLADATRRYSTYFEEYEEKDLPNLYFGKIHSSKRRLFSSPFDSRNEFGKPQRIFYPRVTPLKNKLSPGREGFCDYCCEEFKDPTKHLKTKKHNRKSNIKRPWTKLDNLISKINKEFN